MVKWNGLLIKQSILCLPSKVFIPNISLNEAQKCASISHWWNSVFIIMIVYSLCSICSICLEGSVHACTWSSHLFSWGVFYKHVTFNLRKYKIKILHRHFNNLLFANWHLWGFNWKFKGPNLEIYSLILHSQIRKKKFWKQENLC